MFSVTSEQRQYLTYVLQDDQCPARVEVVPERGGILTRWSVDGKELLYLDEERFAQPELSVRGGIPILFPICGNLPNDTYRVNGQDYHLKQHGFARNLPWAIAEQESQTSACLTLELASSDETRQLYPFDFRVRFTYRLQGNTLTLQQEVKNQGLVSMPFSLGLHPYFQVADKQALRFQIPATEWRSQQDGSLHPFTGQFDFDLDEIDGLFGNLSAQEATVIDPVRQVKIAITSVDPYSMLVFWTLKGKDFYCLEPWTAGRNALNTGDRLIHLAPDMTLGTIVRLTATSLA